MAIYMCDATRQGASRGKNENVVDVGRLLMSH